MRSQSPSDTAQPTTSRPTHSRKVWSRELVDRVLNELTRTNDTLGRVCLQASLQEWGRQAQNFIRLNKPSKDSSIGNLRSPASMPPQA
jgi:hypothetical protein